MTDPLWLANLERWQTLIGALVALFAALLGALYLDRQTQQAARIETERRDRARAAVRAALPLWLSAICDYAKSVSGGLRPLARASGEAVPSELLLAYSPVSPSPELIDNLQKTIESESNIHVIRVISEIMSELQVLNSRTKDFPNAPPSLLVTKSNIEVYLLQAAKIYALASSIFSYARREVEEVDAVVTGDQLRVALRVLDLDGHEFSRLAEMADRMTAES